MKNHFKFLLITVLLNICLSNTAKCQIILEQDYDSSTTILKYINFQINGEKYVRLCYPQVLGPSSYFTYTRKIDIYNLNHSLWKTIPLDNITFYPDSAVASYGILYLSDSLFDTDNLIEFLFTSAHYPIGSGIPTYATYIYNENLNVVFSDTTTAILFQSSLLPENHYPVFNTSNGTKMILNAGQPAFKARLYSLPGVLSKNPFGVPTDIEINERTTMKMNLYPNPSSGNVTVEYDLPSDVPQADLVFYDVKGKKIKSFKIDHTFHNLYLSTNDLASGTYFCQIETSNGALGVKKMIRVVY